MSKLNSRRHSLPKLEVENLSYPLYASIYPNLVEDTILGIPPGESYSGIRALADLSVCVKIYQHLLTDTPLCWVSRWVDSGLVLLRLADAPWRSQTLR